MIVFNGQSRITKDVVDASFERLAQALKDAGIIAEVTEIKFIRDFGEAASAKVGDLTRKESTIRKIKTAIQSLLAKVRFPRLSILGRLRSIGATLKSILTAKPLVKKITDRLTLKQIRRLKYILGGAIVALVIVALKNLSLSKILAILSAALAIIGQEAPAQMEDSDSLAATTLELSVEKHEETIENSSELAEDKASETGVSRSELAIIEPSRTLSNRGRFGASSDQVTDGGETSIRAKALLSNVDHSQNTRKEEATLNIFNWSSFDVFVRYDNDLSGHEQNFVLYQEAVQGDEGRSLWEELLSIIKSLFGLADTAHLPETMNNNILPLVRNVKVEQVEEVVEEAKAPAVEAVQEEAKATYGSTVRTSSSTEMSVLDPTWANWMESKLTPDAKGHDKYVQQFVDSILENKGDWREFYNSADELSAERAAKWQKVFDMVAAAEATIADENIDSVEDDVDSTDTTVIHLDFPPVKSHTVSRSVDTQIPMVPASSAAATSV